LDNACGGLRGNRAEHTNELANLLNAEYGFAKSAKYIDLEGSSSLNLYVESNQTRYVVRVYRPYVTSNRLDDIICIRKKLNENDIPCSKTHQNIKNQNYIIWNDRLVEIEYFIKNDGVMDTLEKLQSALPLFGKMTSVLGDIENISTDSENPHFANQIHFEQITKMIEKGCARILSWNPTDSELEIVDISKKLEEMVTQAGGKIFSKLPQQLAHGDFWDNNVLFNGNKIALIVDFDFMGKRRRIEDIALTLYYSHISDNLCKSDTMSTERAFELKQLLNLYESGLNTRLTETERIALPIAIALQALWGIGGWVVKLDDENTARNHVSGMAWELEQCKYIMDNLDEWQEIFYK